MAGTHGWPGPAAGPQLSEAPDRDPWGTPSVPNLMHGLSLPVDNHLRTGNPVLKP